MGGDTIPTQTFLNLDQDKKDRIINAAMDEFSNNQFEHAKLSNIVRAAGIPRGSFYQYFEDKYDLFYYIFELVKDKKMEYLSDLLPNPEDKPFLVLFEELFTAGTRFAIENPRFVKVFSHVIDSKGEIYDQMVKTSLEYANTYYVDYIKNDQAKGRLRSDIDPYVFAKIVIDLTLNVSLDEFGISVEELDYDKMKQRITQIISIIKHGVTKGDANV
ncbi:MAG: TetR/AcrR family transcriptional regulator [Bacilli bacterium]|nr:TetR/AcrR family transcriptional regulator [Bacilli bacterium]MBN2877487.1 TetR/AcrR family transcriptional regulator [Bacilli bacterium]